jgi:hypothetical protein
LFAGVALSTCYVYLHLTQIGCTYQLGIAVKVLFAVGRVFVPAKVKTSLGQFYLCCLWVGYIVAEVLNDE